MKVRKLPLALLLFSGTALAIIIRMVAIPIPAAWVAASNFKNPAAVPDQAEVRVAELINSYLRYINVMAIPTLHGLADLYVDVRSAGATYRIAPGDTIPLKFSDGSTMQAIYRGLSSGYRFIPLAGSLRAPGVTPAPAPVGGSPIGSTGGTGGHYVYTGGPITGPTGIDGGSCLTGNVADCPKDKGSM